MHTRSESAYLGDSPHHRIFTEFTPCASPAPGPLIVLMHGLGGSTNYTQPLVPNLAAHHHLLRFDFPGHGRSAVRPSLAFDDLVSVLESLVEQYSPSEPVILVGHSLGSLVAMHYTAKHLAKVCALTLIGPGRARPGGAEHMKRLAAAARKGPEFMTDATVENNVAPNCNCLVRAFVREVIAAQSGEGYAMTCEAVAGHSDPDYSKINCPTVIVSGNEDRISSLETAMNLKALIEANGKDNVELKVVSSGHQQVLEDTPGVLKAIETVINRANS